MLLHRDMVDMMRSTQRVDTDRFRQTALDYGAMPEALLFAVPLTIGAARRIGNTDIVVPFGRYGALQRDTFALREATGKALNRLLDRINEVIGLPENMCRSYYIGATGIPPKRQLEHQRNPAAPYWEYCVLYYHASLDRILSFEAAAISHHRHLPSRPSPRCQNVNLGGEGMSDDSPGPYFLYLALR